MAYLGFGILLVCAVLDLGELINVPFTAYVIGFLIFAIGALPKR